MREISYLMDPTFVMSIMILCGLGQSLTQCAGLLDIPVPGLDIITASLDHVKEKNSSTNG